MTDGIYEVIDDFQARNLRVLVLDRELDWFSGFNFVEIDGIRYKFILNSIRSWVSIESSDTFIGKLVEFVHAD